MSDSNWTLPKFQSLSPEVQQSYLDFLSWVLDESDKVATEIEQGNLKRYWQRYPMLPPKVIHLLYEYDVLDRELP